MNPRHTALRELIQLGREGRDALPPSLPDEAAWRAFTDRTKPGTVSWIEVADVLDADELESLIRGLVHYTRALQRPLPGLRGITPVVWLFTMLAFHHPEREAALGEWVVKNRVDPWEPFGFVDDGKAYTFEECRQRQRLQIRAALEPPSPTTTGS